MRKLLLATILCLFASPALAQNPTCPTRPVGDSSNACASTAFVAQELAPIIRPAVACNGTTNDVAAINAAGTALSSIGGGIIQLPASTTSCVVGGSSINIPSNVRLRGAGQGATTLKILSNYNGNIISLLGTSNSTISDLTIDAGDFTACTLCNAVFIGNNGGTLSTDFIFERVTIQKIGTHGLTLQGVTNYRISDNTFKLTTAVNSVNEAITVTQALASSNGLITRNILINTGMEVCSANTTISNNVITGYKFGAGISIDPSAFSFNVTVVGNVAGVSSGIDTNAFEPVGVENWAPNSTISGNVFYQNSGPGIYNGGKNSTVTGNVVYDNGQNSGAAGIFTQFADSTFNGNNSSYDGNTSFNTLGAAGPQSYGYSENASTTGVILGSNNFNTNATGAVNNVSGTTSVGLTVGVSGGIPYYKSSSNIASSAALGANALVLGGGAGTAPTSLTGVAAGAMLGSAGVGVAPSWLTAGILSTSLQTPLVLGGNAAGSSLVLQSTSAIGTTDFIDAKVGNNGSTTVWRALHSGNLSVGSTLDLAKLFVNNAVAGNTLLQTTGIAANWIVDFQGTGQTYLDQGVINYRAFDLTVGMQYVSPVGGSLATGGLSLLHNAASTSAATGSITTAGGVGVAKAIYAGAEMATIPTTVSGLGTCTSAREGSRWYVTDQNTAVAYRGAVTGGGSTRQSVLCSNSAWIQD